MKKTILASAILLAGAANAAEIYNNEGTTVSLGGSFRGHVAIQDSDNVKFEDAGTRFDLKVAKEIDSGLKAYGHVEIKNSDNEGEGKSNGLYLNKSYVGLEHNVFGAVELGKQYGLNDDLVMNDFSYENGVYNEDNDLFGSDSEDQLKYTKAFGGASIVVSLMDQDTYAFGATYNVAGLELGGSYNIANDRTVAGQGIVDNSTYIVGARYTLDALVLAAQYQASEVGNLDTSAYGLGAHYTLGQVGIYAMYDILDGDLKSDQGSELVLGADYELAKGVIAFAEYNSSDRDGATADRAKGSDDTLWLGGRVYF
ncbi:MAG: porin [Moritella sp.]|uniref:porin n=1 Tax=Moritella sp. TaxID=78556 RepID=UPI0029AC1F9B|nr:porin [Moritella sp.]MDX2321651.1 porin [Moritella sp.]